MIKQLAIPMMILFIIISFILHLYALLDLIPIYLSSSLLFLSFFIFLLYINNRNRFKGFK
ncbi:hypothetical protein [Bacillus kwashiorkori]|uniref:hypothetical protein n=1 Tax=Bacillus kwashiorkori TaxID=1522318 RepID=UPI00092E6D0E|nr:hypothetical protein [Bacillus kwashiorkori]